MLTFSFVNQEGQIITQANFNNKIYVADFFFTSCPGICKTLTKNLLLVQNEFKNDDLIRDIKCKHIFHKECIDKWLKEESYKCPNCKCQIAEYKPNI